MRVADSAAVASIRCHLHSAVPQGSERYRRIGAGLEFGWRTPGARQGAAFTLVELVAAMAIMALATGLVAPALEGGMTTRSVWRTTRQFASTLRYLRAEAIVTGKIHELVIDVDDNSYRSRTFDKEVRLPEDAAFVSVQGGELVGGQFVRVLFFPNGGTSGVEALVGAAEDPQGALYRVTLDPLIGAIAIEDGHA